MYRKVIETHYLELPLVYQQPKRRSSAGKRETAVRGVQIEPSHLGLDLQLEDDRVRLRVQQGASVALHGLRREGEGQVGPLSHAKERCRLALHPNIWD